MYNWFNRYFGNKDISIPGVTKKELKAYNNDITFQAFFEYFYLRLFANYNFEGFEETMDMDFFTENLITTGRSLCAEVNKDYRVTLIGNEGAGVTINGYATNAYGTGKNGYNKEFSLYIPYADDKPLLMKSADSHDGTSSYNAIMCHSNRTGYPPITYVIMASKKSADLWGAMEVATNNLKQPFFVQCSESDVNSVKEAFMRRDMNMGTIISCKNSFDADKFKVWQSGADSGILKEFSEQFEGVKNWFDEIFGINCNPNVDKKERLLVDEVNANNESIKGSGNIWEREIQKFVERYNNWTGRNASFTWGVESEDDEDVEYDVNGETEDTEGNNGDTSDNRTM